LRKLIEAVAIVLAYLWFVSAIVLFTAQFAHSQQVMDTNARDAIAQVKELINQNDRRYEELRVADALRNEQRFEAVVKAELAAEKRLDSVNEFRGQLQDQAATFVTRTELYGSIMGIAGVAIGIVGLLLRKRDSDIKTLTGKAK
jgi:predicted PurR-regulated permease PerM